MGRLKQPGCCECDACTRSGMFVYASKYIFGLIDPKWETYPSQLTKIYRKAVSVHTIEHYDTPDGGTTYELAHTETVTVTQEIADCGLTYTKLLLRAESTTNGLLYEFTPTSSFTKDAGDYDKINYPYTSGDFFAEYFNLTTFGSFSKKILAVGEGTVTSELRDDGGGAWPTRFVVTTVLTMSDPLDVDGMADEISAMLATVPLEKRLTNNLVELSYDVDCEIVVDESNSGDSDLLCTSEQDREQTFTPAALAITLPAPTGAAERVSNGRWMMKIMSPDHIGRFLIF